MPYTYETCHEAFQRGLDDRKAYALSSGARRLRESLDSPKRISETIKNIGADIRCGGYGKGRLFGACTSDEAAEWLQSVRAQIAYNLAYNVVPGIEALKRDGVPDDVVSSRVASASTVMPAFLDHCDEARIELSYDIQPEYDMMESGGSTVQPLVDAVERLIKGTLKVAQPWIDQGSSQVTPITQRSIQPAQQPNNVRSTPP